MAKRVSLFKLLRRELAQRLMADGFAEVPQGASERNHILMYFRDASRGSRLGFWFQRNVKSSDVDAFGSSFNLEFFRSVDDPYDMDGRQRSYYLLSTPEREEMRELQNRMIRRLPPPPPECVLEPWQLRTLVERRERYAQVVTEPFNPRHDVWMRYRDEEDVLAWTSFISRLLPSLIERFEVERPRRANREPQI